MLFLSQKYYKDEGAENALKDHHIDFKKIEHYEKINPKFIIDKENVVAVVIANDSDVIPQWFINIANRIGIPTILIQDGLMVDFRINKQRLKISLDNMNTFNFKRKILAINLRLKNQFRKTTYGLGGCVQIQVWGRKSEEYFIAKGIDRQRIIITGNPLMTELQTTQSHVSEKIILYAPSNLAWTKIIEKKQARQLCKDVCLLANRINNVKTILRPHPSENVKLYQNVIKESGFRVDISSLNTSDLISMAALVITDLSTIALESLALGKPVIIHLPNIEQISGKDFFPHDLINENIVFYSKNAQSLFDCVKKILNDKPTLPKNIPLLEQYIGSPDDRPSIHSAELIEQLCLK